MKNRNEKRVEKMAERINKHTVVLRKKPRIISNAAVAGKKEGEGPLGDEFDMVFEDTTLGETTWEKAESMIFEKALTLAIKKAGLANTDIEAVFAGDLLNQCMSSCFGARDMMIPFAGVYGACSTMALSLILASLAVETGAFRYAAAATSSHFCSAEKQFRYPLEYGGQRAPTAQWTVTGSGAVILGAEGEGPYIDKVHIGTVCDLGIKDMNNMGAAMAPAAKKTIADFLIETKTKPEDYDLILTGDLGQTGTQLLYELLKKESGIDISGVHGDCGLMIYEREKQDVHSGGSGCGCSASVLCSKILNSMRKGEMKKIMFVATGALLSGVSSLQGESIPGIAHGVIIKSEV